MLLLRRKEPEFGWDLVDAEDTEVELPRRRLSRMSPGLASMPRRRAKTAKTRRYKLVQREGAIE